MTLVAIGWRSKKQFSFFNRNTVTKYLSELCCIGEIQQIDGEYLPAGMDNVFRIFFTNNIHLDCCFESMQDARLARQDLISRAILFWGKEQVVFSSGYAYDVVVVPAIKSLTDVMTKEHHAGFAATVANVPYPVHFVYPNPGAAQGMHDRLRQILESLRRFESRKRFKKVSIG